MAMTTTLRSTRDLGERLRATLREAGMSGSDMAQYLGINRTTVSEWLNNGNQPKLGMLRAWADRTNSDLAWLCEGHPGTQQAYELAMMTEKNPELRSAGWQPFDEWSKTAAAGAPSAINSDDVRHQGLEPRTRWFGASPVVHQPRRALRLVIDRPAGRRLELVAA